ncbi:MAG: hypothetical protein AAF602_08510 [Myxococcota bacterium]
MIARTMLAVLALGCGEADPSLDAPPAVDTNTGDDPILLPQDTSIFIPVDTNAPAVVDVIPDDFLYLRHFGSWAPSGNLVSGTLTIREYINFIDTADTVDTGPLPWVCNVEYALTGEQVDNATCPTCDVVYDVTHTVTGGSPANCREPDTPTDGITWQLGYDLTNNRIFQNYFGTDVWVPWYTIVNVDGSPPTNIAYEWEATLALELEDTAEDQ